MTDWPNLIDPEKETEDADPYVIARAIELRDEGQEVCVVTDDTVNYPPRVSVASVCAAYRVKAIVLDDFLGPGYLNVPPSWLRPRARPSSD